MNSILLHKINVISSDPEVGSMITGWLQLSGYRATEVAVKDLNPAALDEIKTGVNLVQGTTEQVAALAKKHRLHHFMAVVPMSDVEAVETAKTGAELVLPWPVDRAMVMVQLAALCRIRDNASAREAMTSVISSMLRVREETLRRFEQLESQKNLSTRQSQLRGEVLSAIRPALQENIEALSTSIDEGLEQIRTGLQGLRKLDTQLKWLEDEAKELQSPIATNLDALQISEIEKL